MSPAPLKLRPLWRYTNLFIIIIAIVCRNLKVCCEPNFSSRTAALQYIAEKSTNRPSFAAAVSQVVTLTRVTNDFGCPRSGDITLMPIV